MTQRSEIQQRLGELELFRECNDDDLARVAAVANREARFEAGDVLYQEGDPARDCYVIVEGEVDVTVGGRFIGSSGPGESVGEMGLLDREPRAARVVATTPVLVQVIESAGFDRLLVEAPSVTLALLRQLSGRMRLLDQTVGRLAALAEETRISLETVAPRSVVRAAPPAGRIALDPGVPGYYENPYAQYALLREHDPLHHQDDGTWLVLRYDDILAVNRNRELSAELQHAAPCAWVDQERERVERMHGLQTKMMFRRNPPEHTRMRRQVYRHFTPKAVKELRPRLQELVDRSLDRMAEKGETELIDDFAFPLPLVVISEMLGMPPGDDHLIRGWSQAITKALDPVVGAEEVAASVQASQDMHDYLVGVIGEKRRQPADDLLSRLVEAHDQGGLSEEELTDQLTLLYIAGHETTVNLIGNGMLALLRNRDQLDRLRRDPALEANAVEETLRYDSPAQFTRRITKGELEVAGRRLPPGSVLFPVLGSGNRDPDKWGEDADRFDVARSGANEHVSFGGGVHHCLGASLTRMEAQVAIGSLVRRFPAMELAAEPAFSERMALRGLTGLRLDLGR